MKEYLVTLQKSISGYLETHDEFEQQNLIDFCDNTIIFDELYESDSIEDLIEQIKNDISGNDQILYIRPYSKSNSYKKKQEQLDLIKSSFDPIHTVLLRTLEENNVYKVKANKIYITTIEKKINTTFGSFHDCIDIPVYAPDLETAILLSKGELDEGDQYIYTQPEGEYVNPFDFLSSKGKTLKLIMKHIDLRYLEHFQNCL